MTGEEMVGLFILCGAVSAIVVALAIAWWECRRDKLKDWWKLK